MAGSWGCSWRYKWLYNLNYRDYTSQLVNTVHLNSFDGVSHLIQRAGGIGGDAQSQTLGQGKLQEWEDHQPGLSYTYIYIHISYYIYVQIIYIYGYMNI